MITRSLLRTQLASLLTLSALLFAGHAHAAKRAQISHAWIAEAPPVSKVHAGYFMLSNHSANAVSLVSVKSNAYDKIEMHLSVEKDGLASMQRQDEITIPQGKTIEFAPGGYHLMLYTPARRFTQGDTIQLQFILSDGTAINTSATVKKHQAAGGHRHHH